MSINTEPHFCILPWIHLHVAQNGRVSPCCNNNRYLGNVQEQSIENIWKGKEFKKTREQFKNNIRDKRCNHCYNIEKSGKESLRQVSNKKYAKEIVRVENENPEPIYLDIRFSNICNFKCKTCWHGNSSAWYEEGSSHNASDKRIIKAFTNNFDELMEYMDNVEEIYFAGGEPLIMEEHYQILTELENRALFGTQLRYNTNFSTLNFKNKNILDIWRKFKNVHVSASIDAASLIGEEIREGFNWKQFLMNRKKMKAVCPETYFEITPTVSSLNINHLPELHQEMVNQNLLDINHIYLNILERPASFNIQQLSAIKKLETKQIISTHIEWLKENDATITVLKDYQDLLRYLLLA